MTDQKFIALDFETTGKYPLSAEICEVALLKFTSSGEVLDKWESLIQPTKGMNPVAQSIHGLSLEDLKGAPKIENVLEEMLSFIEDLPLVGHNLSFDLGFLAFDLDQFFGEMWLSRFLKSPNFCTSKLSLELLPKLNSHRLKHLVEHFGLSEAPNHRAYQDALTCKNVFVKLIQNCKTVKEAVGLQKDALIAADFSTLKLVDKRPEFRALVKSVKDAQPFELVYSKGSKRDQWRKVEPLGLVLKTCGESFLVAQDPGQTQSKRFLIDKVLDSRISQG